MADDEKQGKKNLDKVEVPSTPKQEQKNVVRDGKNFGPYTPEEAKEIISKGYNQAMEMITSTTREASAPGPLGAVTASESDITKELLEGNPAFGSFIKTVGLAVAEAQTALDKNMVATAKAISETQIDVIAVFEQRLKDDDGMMDEGIVHLQKLPLINYLMPTAYNWSKVFLQADMYVSEFNNAHGFNIKGKTKTAAGGLSFGGGFGFALGGAYADFSQNVDASYSQDYAAGKLHMEATLEPRKEIELPKPFVLQKGPQLKATVGKREDIDKDGKPTMVPAQIVGRQVSITVTLKLSNGDPAANKTVEMSVDNPALNYDGTGTTDDNGQATFTIVRRDGAFEQGTYLQAIVRIWFGLVNDTVVVSL